MIRRLNYTGRRRISRSDVHINLCQEDGRLSFDADLRLAEYKLPSDAYVFVEAYRQTIWMRFSFGTVSNLLAPRDRSLSDFDSPDDILFRVKVTQALDRHILLAEADRIPLRKPEDEDAKRTPLLPVKPDDLGNEIWRIDFSDDRPRLLINHKAGDYRLIGRSPVFYSLVYPEVLRQLLTRVVIIDEHVDSDDPGNWRSLWLRFAQAQPGVGELPSGDEEQQFEWIDSVVAAFSRKTEMLAKFGSFWKGDGAS